MFFVQSYFKVVFFCDEKKKKLDNVNNWNVYF